MRETGRERERPTRGEANAAHVLRARRRLRELLPFLEGEAKSATTKALQEPDTWAAEYWGEEEVVEIADDGGNMDTGRPEQRELLPPQLGATGRPDPQPGLPPQAAEEDHVRGADSEGTSLRRRFFAPGKEPRRRFTSPSSADQDN